MLTIAPLMAILEEKDITQELFSELCGIPPQTLKSMYEGKSISEDNVDRICRTLDVQPHEVLTYTETDPRGHWVWVEGK